MREREGVAATELLNPIANVGEQLGEGKRERGRKETWEVDGSKRVVKITQLISSKPL